MKKRTPFYLTLRRGSVLAFSLLLFLSAGCSRTTTPDADTQIQQAVAATLAAMPRSTAMPLSTPYPLATPLNLAGLFCEYQFCIGHPIEMAFFDVSAQLNPAAPSTYSQGMLASFNANLFIQVMWQIAPGASDPKFLLDTIVNTEIDTREGTIDVMLFRNMNTMYTQITSGASDVLPYGGAGAWVCGDRVFAWKAYTPQAENARPLFDEALARFTCGQ